MVYDESCEDFLFNNNCNAHKLVDLALSLSGFASGLVVSDMGSVATFMNRHA